MKQLLRVAAISVATIVLLASCSKGYCKKSSCHGHKKETVEENVKPVIINEKATQNNVDKIVVPTVKEVTKEVTKPVKSAKKTKAKKTKAKKAEVKAETPAETPAKTN